MVDVFISYSRTDEAKVAMVARAVEAAGYDVWWDAELPPHQAYGDVITDKIGQAKAAMTAPDVADKLVPAGTQPAPDTPNEFAVFLQKEITTWAAVAKKNNIKIQ